MVWWCLVDAVSAAGPAFEVTLSPAIRQEAYTGRVYVLTSRGVDEPRRGPDWFHPEPFLAKDVVNWRPGETVRITAGEDGVLTFPKEFGGVDLNGSRVQGVVRLNPWEREVGTGAGNGFSLVGVAGGDGVVRLLIDRIVPENRFDETRWSKELVVPSELLSRFWQREVVLRACVTLPASYDEFPNRRYPVMFVIPGFSGTHLDARRDRPVEESNEQGVEFLRVTLDPSWPLGHHVFADSANNGPVGQALVEEVIPAFEAAYRSVADSRARFLNGHSSGGWSSLWLQVTYPESFGGVWSSAPDPVDFRDFQRIDLSEPGVNMYVDPQGDRRPIAVDGDRVRLWYDDFCWMEHVLGYGGQMHSFEAVFSPRGEDGRPQPLWDRKTGVVDAGVAESWEPYDIRQVLERNWETLGPKLAGKLHIFMGGSDTFLLEGATRLLGESLRELRSDAVVEIVPGRDHRTLLDEALRLRIRREMTAAFLEAFGEWPLRSDESVGER